MTGDLHYIAPPPWRETWIMLEGFESARLAAFVGPGLMVRLRRQRWNTSLRGSRRFAVVLRVLTRGRVLVAWPNGYSLDSRCKTEVWRFVIETRQACELRATTARRGSETSSIVNEKLLGQALAWMERDR